MDAGGPSGQTKTAEVKQDQNAISNQNHRFPGQSRIKFRNSHTVHYRNRTYGKKRQNRRQQNPKKLIPMMPIFVSNCGANDRQNRGDDLGDSKKLN
jgi:hypothetical protein